MPVYEYRCQNCWRKVSVFFRSFSDTKAPSCEHCGSTDLTRLMSQVVVHKAWGDSVNLPDAALEDVDENNPEQMKDWMRRLKQGVGDDPRLTEADLLDAGIDPHGENGLPDHDHGGGSIESTED